MSGTIALVRPPGSGLGKGCYSAARPVDLALARRQHENYTEALAAAGVRVQAVPADDDLPDAAFIGDTLIVRGGLAILARPGDAGREPELIEVEKAVRGLGLEVARVGPPGTLEGGDVIQTAGSPYGDAVYVGRSSRTTEDAACRLPGIASMSPRAPGIYRVVPVEVRDCRQLAAAMTALPDGTLFGLPDRVDTSALPGLRVAPEPAGAQLVPVGDGRILLPASAPRTAALLKAEGYQVTPVDISEFEALGAALPALAVMVQAAP